MTAGLPKRFSARAKVAPRGAVALQLDRGVVDDLLVVAHPDRTPAVADRRDDLRLDAGLRGDRRMDVPLVVLRPLPRGDEDDKLRERVADPGLVAQVVAHRARE